MPIVTFIRHAETTYNANKIFAGRIDCDLSQKGVEDSLKYYSFNKDDFDIYYCSPLKRSRDTLKLVVKNLEKFYIDERITEISIGDWEGKSKKDFSEDLLNEYRNGLYVPPNAEKTEDVDFRVIDFVSDLFNLYDDKTKILVVTHNGIMRSIKRNFVPNYKNIMSNNLESIVLKRENYNYYLENSRKSKFNR